MRATRYALRACPSRPATESENAHVVFPSRLAGAPAPALSAPRVAAPCPPDAHHFMTSALPEAKSRAGAAERQAEPDAAFMAELEALRTDHERVRIELADV